MHAVIRSSNHYTTRMNEKKPPTQATCLEQPWTRVAHFQTRDSSTLSHVSGYASAIFDLARFCLHQSSTAEVELCRRRFLSRVVRKTSRFFIIKSLKSVSFIKFSTKKISKMIRQECKIIKNYVQKSVRTICHQSDKLFYTSQGRVVNIKFHFFSIKF